MKRNLRLFVEDIEESINNIQNFTQNMTLKKFLEDTLVQDAVLRRLEVIGEATKNIPTEFKDKYPDVPWKKMAGLRDVLTHFYFGINFERVWLVVKDDLPDLKKKIKKILEDMETASE
ncbi:MAG: DUF86 domain-containing protein [Candidatus Aenigmarchaeota archaeon]|nr:DUF86 domain-containing protein [Candidatus Aenigmarchaeota archaeon]